MNNGQESIDAEKSTNQLLQEIASGLTNPKFFDVPTRQKCVELLRGEGQTIPTISQLLKCSEKTISRDIKEIQAQRAFSPSLEFATRFIGHVFQEGKNHHDFLKRLARAQNSPPALKIRAEFAAWEVLKELIEKFQTLGYLPRIPQEVVGDIFHHGDGESQLKSLEEVEAIIAEVQAITEKVGRPDPEVVREIGNLNAQLEKAKLFHRTEELKKQIQLTEEKENGKQ